MIAVFIDAIASISTVLDFNIAKYVSMKKRKKKIEWGKIAWTLLEIIARTPESIASAFLDRRSIYNSFSNDEEFLSDQLMQYLRNLKREGYIETKKMKDSVGIRLTIKGKIKNLEHSSNRISDGRIRVISYDIPEKYKYKRQLFCRLIRRIGFKRLQKSLWVCSYIKADQIDIVIDDLGLRKYIAYFIIEKSNVDDFIGKLLKGD